MVLKAFNEKRKTADLLARLQAGESVAVVSDAGTPLISDPGFLLVKAAWDAGIQVSPIPGASSVTAALSVCPLKCDHWSFLGFLPTKKILQLTMIKLEISQSFLNWSSSTG